jgi:integrase
VRAVAKPNNEDTGSPFTDAELAVIFGPAFAPWAAKYPHRWFGVALGLYSGARVNEIAQLRLEDVGTEDEVPGFHVRNRDKDQRIKNKSSRRFVPLAKPLINAGFLAYVEEARAAGHDRLFPNLPNSTGLGFGPQLSRQFSAFIKEQGITAKGQGFHGFRHTIASRLDAAGVSEAAISVLTGHKHAETILQRHYIDRASLPDRLATLARFVPPVQLPDYEPGQFAQALADAPIKLRKAKPKQKKPEEAPLLEPRGAPSVDP